MAKCRLIGVQELDFEANDGKPIKGVKLHLSYPSDVVYGEKVDTKFISDNLCRKIGVYAEEMKELVGGEIELLLNPDGKLVGVAAV